MAGGGPASDNILARNFRAECSGIKWCTDVTEFRAGGQKLFLSALQDLFNNEIVAWQTSTSQSQPLVCRMLKKALKACRNKEGAMIKAGLTERLYGAECWLTQASHKVCRVRVTVWIMQ